MGKEQQPEERYEDIEGGTRDTWTGEVWLDSWDEPVKQPPQDSTVPGWSVDELSDLDWAFLDGLVNGGDYARILDRGCESRKENTMYTYSFQYNAEGDSCTTIGNFYEAQECLHVLPGQPGYDEAYLDLEQLCREQIERERPGVNVTAVDIMGVTEPDGEFYYLPDHVQAL
jgi:hypothetical protein